MNLHEILSKLPADLVGASTFNLLNAVDIVLLYSACCSYRSISSSGLLECGSSKQEKKITKTFVSWYLESKCKSERIIVGYDFYLELERTVEATAEEQGDEVGMGIEVSFMDWGEYQHSKSAKINDKVIAFILCKMDEIGFKNLRGLNNLAASSGTTTLLQLLKRNAQMSKLHVENAKHTPISNIFADLMHWGPSLTDLSLCLTSLRGITPLLGAHCPALRDLTLKQWPKLNERQNVGVGLSALADGCLQLRTLRLIGIRAMAFDLRKITSKCQHLRSLVAPDTPMTDIFVDGETATNVTPLQLQELVMTGGCFLLHTTAQTSRFLFSNLITFTIHLSSNVCLVMVTLAFEHVVSLTSLDMKISFGLRNEAVESVLAALNGRTLLRTLRFKCFVDSALQVSFCRLIASLPQLEVLEAQLLSDAPLITLAQACPRLHTLRCSQHSLVTDAGVEALVRGCPLLRHLVSPLSNAMLRMLQTHCPLLETLHVYHAEELCMNALVELVHHRQALKELHVDCSDLSESDVVQLRKCVETLKVVLDGYEYIL